MRIIASGLSAALAGAGATVAVGLLFGVPMPGLVQVGVAAPVAVQGIPDPSTMVEIHAGVPFVVPNGKLLVVTALGTEEDLFVDGVKEMGSQQSGDMLNYSAVPPGFTVQAGSTIDGAAWGYLVDA